MDKWIATLVLAGMLVIVGSINRPELAEDLDGVSVMSYNMHHGVDHNGIYGLDNVAEVINRAGAEIVALQEIDVLWGSRSYMTDQLLWLESHVKMNSAFGPALKNSTGFYGVGILSKYPIISSQYYLLPGKLEQRVLLVAGIDIKGKMVYVFNTHLGLSEEDRVLQAAKILEIAQLYENEHKILLGDFNTTSDAFELAPLKRYFIEERSDLSTGLSETLIGGKRKIDAIFVSPSILIEKLVTLVYGGSDHFPLWARIRIP